jgi:hypothetical protein
MMIYNFLHVLHKFHLCCFLTGTFVLFAAGRLDSFDGVTVFIAMTDSPIIYILFQKIHSPASVIDDFTFTLVIADRPLDLFHYMISSGHYITPVSVCGIDTTKHCCPLSNIDLVHFVWKNFLRFSYINMQWRSQLRARPRYLN